MVVGVHCAITYAAGVADCQSGAGRRAAGVGAVFAADGALAVYIAMGKLYFFPCEACPLNICTFCCFQIALGVCLIVMQREGNVRRKGFTCKQIYIYFCDNRA